MYALFVEVDVDDFKVEEARKGLNEVAVPMAQQHGATAGYWLGPKGGRGMSVVIFDSVVGVLDLQRRRLDLHAILWPLPRSAWGVNRLATRRSRPT